MGIDSRSPIVVLSYNKPNLTTRCLTSIVEAGYDTGEVYLIDNGSSPGILEEHLGRFPGLHAFRTEQNLGFAGGFNFGLRSVFESGHLSALFLTNDTEITPQTVEHCMTCAGQHRAGIVAPCITYRKHPDKIDSIGGSFNRKTSTLRHYQDVDLPPLLGKSDYVPGTALWISAEAFRTLGGTDERYHMYWEDVDLSFRAHEAGIVQARCYEAKIRHGIGQTCHKKPIYTLYYFQRNRIHFCRKYLTPDAWAQASRQIEMELNELEERAEAKSDEKRLDYIAELKNLLLMNRQSQAFQADKTIGTP